MTAAQLEFKMISMVITELQYVYRCPPSYVLLHYPYGRSEKPVGVRHNRGKEPILSRNNALRLRNAGFTICRLATRDSNRTHGYL
ncbi:hypothetical protein N7509_006555 [Penicillium cosmopolitanum]|uniref:Uncharacterized protein n=1 Tax=Penicillium cosmopolitanum TaxID=1131564 RepID=A0A9W9VXN1_9EURO|nr:uncharacterized protein N7509_006555 [Penicillium cosmopolitanum]KAJ5391065.1 hypothetical protein N7509_006555 [Penicillium cosmopolitanum]